MKKFICTCLLASVLAWVLRGQDTLFRTTFPTWEYHKPVSFWVLFTMSPIVAVAELNRVHQVGVQNVSLSGFMQGTRRIYWCQGDLSILAVVKGQFKQPSSKYVFAAFQPDCRYYFGDPIPEKERRTKVWFLREEDRYLRPAFDAGSKSFGIRVHWDRSSPIPPRQLLGEYLLTPGVVGVDEKEFGELLAEVGDFACELLGQEACRSRLEDLYLVGSMEFRKNVCDFFTAQGTAPCKSRDGQ